MVDSAPQRSTRAAVTATAEDNARPVPSVACYLAAILRDPPPLNVDQIDTLRQIFAPPQP
jgi:hypothetical protein